MDEEFTLEELRGHDMDYREDDRPPLRKYDYEWIAGRMVAIPTGNEEDQE